MIGAGDAPVPGKDEIVYGGWWPEAKAGCSVSEMRLFLVLAVLVMMAMTILELWWPLKYSVFSLLFPLFNFSTRPSVNSISNVLSTYYTNKTFFNNQHALPYP